MENKFKILILLIGIVGLIIWKLPKSQSPSPMALYKFEEWEGVCFSIAPGLGLTAHHNTFECPCHYPMTKDEFKPREGLNVNKDSVRPITECSNGTSYLLDLALLEIENIGNSFKLNDDINTVTPGEEIIIESFMELHHRLIPFKLEGKVKYIWEEDETISMPSGKEFKSHHKKFLLDVIGYSGMSGSPVRSKYTDKVIGVIQSVSHPKMGYLAGILIEERTLAKLK